MCEKEKIEERVGEVAIYVVFFFNDTATTEIYTLSLHDALPISDAVISINSSVGKKNYFQANQISACYQQELCIFKIGRAHV